MTDTKGINHNAQEERVELHAHTHLSAFDSLISPRELAEAAVRLGHKAIAVTDQGVVQAFPEFQQAAAEVGIKAIFGMEGHLVDDDTQKMFPVTILVKNQAGLRNLYRLVTLSHYKYFYKIPRIPRNVFTRYRNGLLLGSGCLRGELGQAIMAGTQPGTKDFAEIARFYDFLEIHPDYQIRVNGPLDEESIAQYNQMVVDVGSKSGIPVVATGNVHYLTPDDAMYWAVIREHTGKNQDRYQAQLHLRTTEEMLEIFAFLGVDKAYEVVVANPCQIAAMIKEIKLFPPADRNRGNTKDALEIRKVTAAKAKSLYGQQLPTEIRCRLNTELGWIRRNRWSSHFRLAHELIQQSRAGGYSAGDRLHAGGSFVAYLLAITDLNPLPPHWRCHCCTRAIFAGDLCRSGFDLADRVCPGCGEKMTGDGHDILFAGFMTNKIESVFEFEVAVDNLPQLLTYLHTVYGEERVFRLGAITWIPRSMAVDIGEDYFNRRRVKPLTTVIEKIAAAIKGKKRATFPHSNSYLILDDNQNLHDLTPVQYPDGKKTSHELVTHFDYQALKHHSVQFSLIGSEIYAALDKMAAISGINIQYIPFDDLLTFELFTNWAEQGKKTSQTGLAGIPEFEMQRQKKGGKRSGRLHFSDIVEVYGRNRHKELYSPENADPDENIYLWKAMAVARVMTAYRYAFYKIHYPQAFYQAYFGTYGDEADRNIIRNGRAALRKAIKSAQASKHRHIPTVSRRIALLELALEMYDRGITLTGERRGLTLVVTPGIANNRE